MTELEKRFQEVFGVDGSVVSDCCGARADDILGLSKCDDCGCPCDILSAPTVVTLEDVMLKLDKAQGEHKFFFTMEGQLAALRGDQVVYAKEVKWKLKGNQDPKTMEALLKIVE